MISTPTLTFNLCPKTLRLKLQNILLSPRRQLPRFTLSKFKLNSEEYGAGEIIYNLLRCQPYLWAEDNTHLYSCYLLLCSSIFHIPQDRERGARGERCLLSSQAPGRMNNVNKARSLPSGPLEVVHELSSIQKQVCTMWLFLSASSDTWINYALLQKMLFVFRKYSLLGKPISLTIRIMPSQEYNLKLQ